ncbi:uncharacterized protein TRIREDRAFT_105432 [Trichoderma reesei QM6a]|uniref:Predicted protein n=2 Tax=Hypocrea jecorina TaxID=51453 RepID=G0REI9_HYPJQ|nr:uncharacterized protein TRIREDRAFT_105432 [Trichoderma reesei QM6a]EGR50153.1 predicted protein [Trichoderma reesei QM6a]ETS03790.1 hypothetical protein M419DRAFT_74636 [Trichoderma reesei RUT C-30]
MDVYQQHQHQQDSLAVAQNGNAADDDDIEDDGDLDDDMMDRISSSPSIEDALTPRLPLQLPARQTQTFCTRFAMPIIIIIFLRDPAGYCVDTVEHETYEAERDCDRGCDCDNGQDLCAHQNEADTEADPDADADLSLTIPYNKSFEDDDDSDFSLPDDPRFIDYGWAAECLHEPEDIDFEFVYALHTFVATVEGQANATKGDTMVLLDDSNSYWWLVRVVKDSSIGYLPAEHIETPTERLARLNKHRNIDLSASMLTDQQPPKQKSGFSIGIKKKATVVFTEPTYFDYSDHDYSSEEEDADEASEPVKQKKQAPSGDDEDATDESARVEPLKPNKPKTAKPLEQTQDDSSDDEDLRGGSLEIVEKRDGPSISRNGNIRNTDSFFKDETTETKKITLTPNLLRDDGPRESTDSMSSGKPRTSLDRFEKELMSDKDRKKSKDKDRRDKDKKPGGLRGFFSRKDKKQSPDDRPEGESRDSEERHSEDQSSPEKPRQPAKLHKQQARVEPTVNNKAPQASTVELASYLAESRINDVSNVPPPSMRIVNPETNETQEVPSHQPPRGRPSLETTSPTTRRGPEVAISPRSATAPRALNHLDLSDSEESDDGDAILDRMPQPNSSTPIRTTKAPQDEEVEEPIIPGSFPDGNPSAAADQSPVSQPTPAQSGARSHSVSPVSPVTSSEPPALMVDTSSPDDRSPSASPSPELTQSAEDRSKSSSSSTGSKEQTWDDMKLHAFFNEPDHVRDLLVVVYDKTDVVPASSDHPVVGGLFREQNAKLAEITTQLDNMLGDWLARKQRTRGSR